MKTPNLYAWLKLISWVGILYLSIVWIGPTVRELLDNRVYDIIESKNIDAGALFYTEEERAVEAEKELSIKIKE